MMDERALSRVTLEMWRVFVTIAQEGSNTKAAEVLHKSQSTLSHALKKMEAGLGHALFEIQGRHLVLTTLGKILLPKAQRLLGEAESLEKIGRQYKQGFLDEISIAIDMLVPPSLLTETLERFELIHPNVSVRIFETTLSGARQLLEDGTVAIGLANRLPTDMIIEPLCNAPLTCVCAPNFELAQTHPITLNTLKAFRHIVVQDSGKANINSGWLGSTKRLTVSHVTSAVALTENGLGYAWLPTSHIASKLHTGHLIKIPLTQGAERCVNVQIGLRPDLLPVPEIKDLFDLFQAVAHI